MSDVIKTVRQEEKNSFPVDVTRLQILRKQAESSENHVLAAQVLDCLTLFSRTPNLVCCLYPSLCPRRRQRHGGEVGSSTTAGLGGDPTVRSEPGGSATTSGRGHCGWYHCRHQQHLQSVQECNS